MHTGERPPNATSSHIVSSVGSTARYLTQLPGSAALFPFHFIIHAMMPVPLKAEAWERKCGGEGARGRTAWSELRGSFKHKRRRPPPMDTDTRDAPRRSFNWPLQPHQVRSTPCTLDSWNRQQATSRQLFKGHQAYQHSARPAIYPSTLLKSRCADTLPWQQSPTFHYAQRASP